MNVLMVGGWSSSCLNCRKIVGAVDDAAPSESGHYTLLGYSPLNGSPGCGLEWDYWTSETYYGYNEEQQQAFVDNFEERHPHLKGKYRDAIELFSNGKAAE